jgi:hypothetical protein
LFKHSVSVTKVKILPTGAQIQGQQFLVANTTVTNVTVGFMGVGLGASFFNEITLSDNSTHTSNANSTSNQTVHHLRAPNIIDQMAAQGIISSRAFGLDLGNEAEGD